MYAGMKESVGDYTVIIDADLQQDPAYVLRMMQILDEDDNLDSVAAFQEKRREGKILRAFKSTFYHMINRVSQVEFVDGASDFRLLSRPMVDAIMELSEYNRFSKGIFAWVGFETEYLEYKNVERVAGETSWNFWSLFKYSIEGIVNFSDAPLNIAFIGGLLSWILAFIMMILIVIRTLVFGDPTSGWPSLMTVILFLGGFQLLTIGILGKYIGKIFMETKKRPIYVIKEKSEE